jgi:hypothetical protein
MQTFGPSRSADLDYGAIRAKATIEFQGASRSCKPTLK